MTAATEGRPFDARPIGLVLERLGGSKTSRKTRATLGRGDSPRTGQPVWRNSYYVGQIEDRVWKPILGGKPRDGKRWTGALFKAARGFELKTRRERQEKAPGARNGALGEVGLEVLEYLYRVVDYARGTLEPAVRTIAAEIGRSYSAVHDALRRLRRHGFLDWMRRSKPVEDPQPGGPRVEQASNAYTLLVPEGMRRWLARLIGQGNIPACEEERLRRKREEFEGMLAGLTASEYHAQPFNRANRAWDELAGNTLARIAAAVDRREALLRESGRADETGGSVPDP